jgi:hypothetical protein
MSSPTPQHPDEEDLLRLLDGDLSDQDVRRLQCHLESCWHCRKERNEMQAAIDEFVRYREQVLLPQLPAPPRNWPDLRLRCESLDQSSAPAAARSWTVWRIAAASLIGMAVFAAVVIREYGSVKVELPKAKAASEQVPRPKIVQPPAHKPAVSKPQRSLLSVEVEVIQALHQAAADLGEPIEVAIATDEVVVKATALEPTRAEEIRAAITAIPGARFELNQPRTVTPETAPGSVVKPRPIIFGAREDLANAVVDLSETILARAHAWNKLEERFAAVHLDATELRTIHAIQAEHLAAVRRDATRLRSLLATVFPEPDLPAPAPRPLIRAAREFDELISAGFAGAHSTLTDAEILARLQSVLKELAQ